MGSPLCVPVNTSVENQLSLLLSAPLHGPSQHPPSSDPKCLWPAVSAHSIWWGGGALPGRHTFLVEAVTVHPGPDG